MIWGEKTQVTPVDFCVKTEAPIEKKVELKLELELNHPENYMIMEEILKLKCKFEAPYGIEIKSVNITHVDIR